MGVREEGLVFVSGPEGRPAIEIRVNFGVFTGRMASPAEIDRLAAVLLELVPAVSIVSEERHEIGASAESSVHLVRVDVARGVAPEPGPERRTLEQRLAERAERWAQDCIADRPSALTDL